MLFMDCDGNFFDFLTIFQRGTLEKLESKMQIGR